MGLNRLAFRVGNLCFLAAFILLMSSLFSDNWVKYEPDNRAGLWVECGPKNKTEGYHSDSGRHGNPPSLKSTTTTSPLTTTEAVSEEEEDECASMDMGELPAYIHIARALMIIAVIVTVLPFSKCRVFNYELLKHGHDVAYPVERFFVIILLTIGATLAVIADAVYSDNVLHSGRYGHGAELGAGPALAAAYSGVAYAGAALMVFPVVSGALKKKGLCGVLCGPFKKCRSQSGAKNKCASILLFPFKLCPGVCVTPQPARRRESTTTGGTDIALSSTSNTTRSRRDTSSGMTSLSAGDLLTIVVNRSGGGNPPSDSNTSGQAPRGARSRSRSLSDVISSGVDEAPPDYSAQAPAYEDLPPPDHVTPPDPRPTSNPSPPPPSYEDALMRGYSVESDSFPISPSAPQLSSQEILVRSLVDEPPSGVSNQAFSLPQDRGEDLSDEDVSVFPPVRRPDPPPAYAQVADGRTPVSTERGPPPSYDESMI